MSGGLRQFHGPSARYDRACVELRFDLGDATYRLASIEPVLTDFGFKPAETLPDDPMPLDQAVARLASAMLAKSTLALPAPWWNRHGSENGVGRAAVAHPFPEAAALALESAFGLLQAGERLAPPATAKVRRLSQWLAATLKTRVFMLAAAQAYGLQTAYLHRVTSLYQIGQGARGLHFDQAGNERDSATGAVLDRHKHVAAITLRRLGLPATRGELARTDDEARAAIARVGLPCVVKPVAMNQGQGVATMLRSEAQALAAVAHVRTLSPDPVLIENHVEGTDHRIMVSGDEFLWAYRKDPASVTGDGAATIGELIARENARRKAIRHGPEAYLYPMDSDEPVARLLADRYGLSLDSVLERGRRIEVASQANIARGATLTDVTGEVHPDNRTMAIRAARLIRTRTMGIDFVTPDISRSWKEVDCAMVEVNRTPATSGVGDASLVLRALFPNRLSGRIPTVAVLGDADFCARAAERISAAFAGCGLRLVVAHYREPNVATPATVTHSSLAPVLETAMLDPQADAILVVCEPARVERQGFPLPRCDILVAQDEVPPWLAATATTILPADAPPAKFERAVEGLARRYRDPHEGGPLPVLEPIADEAGGDRFRLTVWRARAMPRSWFWREVGVEAPDSAGMTTHDDLLAAVRLLADAALREGGRGKPLDPFTHGELTGSWFRMTFEAALALPAKRRDAARAALLAAAERVNRIAAMKIG